MSDWRSITLGDFVSMQRGHDLPSQTREDGNIPVMGSSGVTGYHSESKANGPGVIIGRSGASIGRISFVEGNYWPLNTCMYVTDFKGNDPKFVYSFLSTLNLAGHNSGSAQPSLNRNYIYPIEIEVPEPKEQREIAAILGALDDKIEVNRKASATLEAMARALYRSWFVDFDPVWAKLENRPPAHMPPQTAALFPDSFDDEGLPLGWRFGTVSDAAVKVQNGGTPSRSNPSFWDDGAIPWLTSGEVRQSMIINTAAKITELGMQNSSAKTVPTGATLVALYGATAGQVSRTAVQLTTNQAICAVIAKNGFENVVFLALQDGIATLADRATGSAQQNISKGIVEAFEMIIPPNRIADEFQRQSEPLFNSVAALLLQNQTLATLRDSLLPRLMSGELRVGDARELAEDAL